MIRFDSVSYTYPFQDTPAVRNISFTVRPGELVLCTGASGCGKSTLIRLANGLCPHYYKGTIKGEVLVNGNSTQTVSLSGLSDDVGTLFQNPEEQFFALNVEEEIAFTHEWRGRKPEDVESRVSRVVRDFGLESVLSSSVHELSEGQKQKVGLASILSQEPGLLVLDEPTANLDPEATADLAVRLAEVKKKGLAVLVVDHRLYWLEKVADRVLIMDKGCIALQGEFSLLHDAAMRDHYSLRKSCITDPRGALPDASTPLSPERSDTGMLQVEGLSFQYPGRPYLFEKANFAVPAGVTAVIGGNGAGKTTLARLLTGLRKVDGGSFRLEGIKVTPGELLRRSCIVLQNADHQLYMRTALEEVLTCIRLGPSRFPVKKDDMKTREKAMTLLDMLGLSPLADRHPQSLSGGEKQRLVIACAFAKQPDILLLDEPTSGMDGRNMRRIAEALTAYASGNRHVLVITHDLELMDRVCESALRLPL